MKASELRIGNYYIDEDGYESIVNLDTFRWLCECIIYNEEIKPILLTGEWLLKFGFELEVDHLSPEYLWGKIEIENPRRAVGVYNPDNEEDWYMMFREDVGINWVDLNEIQYVHQLQNLYFALTGEELTS